MNDLFPSVLTIAGSDSGGGAGIQADLRTFHSFKVYGCSVITAVTSQNPDEVRRVDVLPVEAIRTQMESVLDLFPPSLSSHNSHTYRYVEKRKTPFTKVVSLYVRIQNYVTRIFYHKTI